MYYVYILKSLKTGEKYVGYSTNLKERIKQHNSGQSNHTSHKGPYKIYWYCAFSEKQKALSFEKYLKSSSGFAFTNKHF
jgi:predicted GIY-YIG superfamily endonuclease